MGKLMFAFVVFWAYIAFSQYMLIWYANIPEETVWYRAAAGAAPGPGSAWCCCSATSCCRSWA